MNVLVDTSVWVAHFRHRNGALLGLIGADRVIVHPMVIGEIACGTPPEPRARTLGGLGRMRKANQATSEEVTDLIERAVTPRAAASSRWKGTRDTSERNHPAVDRRMCLARGSVDSCHWRS